MKTKQQLYKKLAQLESINDHLMAEISYVDRLMHLIGFPGGLAALKETAMDFQERGEDFLDETP